MDLSSDLFGPLVIPRTRRRTTIVITDRAGNVSSVTSTTFSVSN